MVDLYRSSFAVDLYRLSFAVDLCRSSFAVDLYRLSFALDLICKDHGGRINYLHGIDLGLALR